VVIRPTRDESSCQSAIPVSQLDKADAPWCVVANVGKLILLYRKVATSLTVQGKFVFSQCCYLLSLGEALLDRSSCGLLALLASATLYGWLRACVREWSSAGFRDRTRGRQVPAGKLPDSEVRVI